MGEKQKNIKGWLSIDSAPEDVFIRVRGFDGVDAKNDEYSQIRGCPECVAKKEYNKNIGEYFFNIAIADGVCCDVENPTHWRPIEI